MKQFKIMSQITNRKESTLDKYLNDISRIAMISPEEEFKLMLRIKQGDATAQNKLIESNLRFVVSVAKQYQYRGVTLPDLINDGNMGLIKAALRFDETRGFKFISYAVWWIRQSITESINENARSVRLPLNKITLIRKINGASLELQQTLERMPSPQEISEFLDIALTEIELCIKNDVKSKSLDMPMIEGESDTLYATIEHLESPNPESTMLRNSLIADIDTILTILSPREKNILILFFGLHGGYPNTIEDIAKLLKLTKERVRQLKIHALKKLKRSHNASELLDYLV